MNKKLKILTSAVAFGLITCQIATTVPVYATDTTTTTNTTTTRPQFDENGLVTIGGLLYKNNKDGTVQMHHGMDVNMYKIEIPSSISVNDVRYPVTSISTAAFGSGGVFKLTSITIPNSITDIGDYAFQNCRSLEELVLPTGLKNMGSSALLIPYGKLNRIKVNCTEVSLGTFSGLAGDGTFHHAKFYDTEGKQLSHWMIKDNVRINELQDPSNKEGFTFGGWKEEKNFSWGYSAMLQGMAKYTTQYEEGQPLWDMEDRINKAKSKIIVTESTTEDQINTMVKNCVTYPNMEYTLSDFRVVPAQWDVRGAIRCNINLTNKLDGSKQVIEFDKYTTALPGFSTLELYMKDIEVSDKTTQEELKKIIEDKLQDNGLEVELQNFVNDGNKVSGKVIITNTVTGENTIFDLNKVVPGKSGEAITKILGDLKINKYTTEPILEKSLTEQLGDKSYTVDVKDFKNEDGKLQGSIEISKDGKVVSTTPLDKAIPARTQTKEDIKTSLETSIKDYPLTNSSTEQDIRNWLNDKVKDPSIEVSLINFKNKNGVVSGDITIKDVDTKEETKITLQNKSSENIVSSNLENLNVGSKTTDKDIVDKIKAGLNTDTTDVEIKNFKNDNGHITGTVIIDNGVNKISLPLDKTAVAQTVEEALASVNKNLLYYNPTASTTMEETIALFKKDIKDIDVDLVIPDFYNNGNEVTGTVTIIKADGTHKEMSINKRVKGSNGTANPNTNNTSNNSNTTSSNNSNSNTTPGNNSGYPSNGGPSATTSAGAIANIPSSNVNTTISPTITTGNTTVTIGNTIVNTPPVNVIVNINKDMLQDDSKTKGNKNIGYNDSFQNDVLKLLIEQQKAINNLYINGNRNNGNVNGSGNDISSGSDIFGINTITGTQSEVNKIKSGWYWENRNWYYYNSDGSMRKGWVTISGLKYYLEPSTGILKTGWFKDIDGKYYYLKAISDGTQGSALTGWNKINDSWYYFYSDGMMASNATIDSYQLNADGRLV